MVVEPGEGGGCEEEQHTALSFTADPRRGSKIRNGGDEEDVGLGDTM